MKCLFKFLFVLLPLMGGVMTSCSSNEDLPGKSTDNDEEYDVEVKDIDLHECTAEEMADLLYGPVGSNDEEKEARREAFLKRDKEKAERIIKEMNLEDAGANGFATRYIYCTYNYRTKGYGGKDVWLSSFVSWGGYWWFGVKPLDPDYINLMPHFTITSNAECPTELGAIEIDAAVGDLLLILPDYLGYGLTKDMVHPYMNHELGAQHCIDALIAGKKVFDQQSGAKLEDDCKLYVSGASQGGGMALAVHKWLDTHPTVANEFKFAYSYCGAGPYSPVITFKEYMRRNEVSYPIAIILTLNSMIASYPEVLGKYKESDFYSAAYYNSRGKADVDRAFAAKSLSANALNKVIYKAVYEGSAGAPESPRVRMTDLCSKEVLDPNSQIYKDFMACLDKNDLTKGWTPTHPIKLFHSLADEVVPYENAFAVQYAFGDMVTLKDSPLNVGHVKSCGFFMADIFTAHW